MLELLEKEYKGPPEVMTYLGHPLLTPHHTRSQSSKRAGIVLPARCWIQMEPFVSELKFPGEKRSEEGM